MSEGTEIDAAPMTFKPEAWAILQERWSDKSPPEGTELCVCSWCGKMIGRHERDPVWEDHIEWCGGCEVCEIPVRMWKKDPCRPGKMFELRFHHKCMRALQIKATNVPESGADD